MADLSDIITSKVRGQILELMYSNVNEMYHVREVVRQTKQEINAVRRELEKLAGVGILKSEPRGNRLYYWPRKEYLFFDDFLAIVAKSTGIGKQLVENKNKIGKVSFIMFSGRFARRMNRKDDDEVDILLVGEVVLPELAGIVRMEESKRGVEINYTVMSREELEFRKKRRDPFLLGVLAGSRTMILGNEEELVG